MPLVANLAFEILTLEIVTSEFPAFVIETPRTLLAPTDTVPKFKLVALLFRREVAATPVPLMETVPGEVAASLTMDTVPGAAPRAFGENTTLNVDCFPAPITRGREIPVIVNPFTAVVTCVTLRLDPPALVIVTD
jgi:hypothetical protein